MGKRAMVGAVLLAAAFAVPAEAAVVCQKKSGAMFVRAACKTKETVLDLSTLGALGPKGDTGDTGAPGSARAYACANSLDGTTVSFCFNRPAKNVLSVVANSSYPGYTCFVLDPSIDANSAVVVASLNTTSAFSGGKINALIGADGYNNYQGCPLNSVVVVTARHTNSGASLGLEYTILGVSIAVQ
jgi:hypothetical protein